MRIYKPMIMKNLRIILLMLCSTLSILSFAQTAMNVSIKREDSKQVCYPEREKARMKFNTSNKTVVAYFSATGTTRAVAERIATLTNATLCEIAPATPYTAADLDWLTDRSRSSIEMSDTKARPAMQPITADLAACDTLYLGYPIWWDLAPRIINTFMESYDLEGKTIIPFATSGSSTITNSVRELKKTYPALHIYQGHLLNNASEQSIRQWVNQMK